MSIQEAVKIAIEQRKYIRRKTCFYGRTLIQPTNTYDCCMIFVQGDRRETQSRFWNPTADDLMADDWEVVEG